LKKEKANKELIQKRKITLFVFLFSALLLFIAANLFNIQILNAAKYKIAAKKQYESRISIKSVRGLIYDRKQNVLVSNVNKISVAADPNMIDNKDSVAEIFSKIFQKEKSSYLDKLNFRNTSFVWIERRIDPQFETAINELNISGIIKMNESFRTFSNGDLASQLLGLTDLENNGIAGLELENNEILAGKPGYVVMQKDGLGKKRPAVEYPRSEPINGNSLVLTIDMNIQKIIEEELSNGVSINNAVGGKCIVMSVKTGEILGMASMVSFTSNDSLNVGKSVNKLSLITDLYEPGSTFKFVTAAASLEEGLENKFSIIATQSGEYVQGNIKIKDAHKHNSNLSFQQVVEQSSNVGMIQIANKLGSSRFYKYARDFGFGIYSGIDFPGEVRGMLKRPVEFSPVSLQFMAIGYEVLVTAMQMTNAFSCIANNGVMMKPFIVKKVLSPDGKIIKENFPTVVRNVVSKTTANGMTELLYGVVERGTGKDAKIENLKIAGKTGTSQRVINGKHSKQSYTASFIGYFPADNPQIVISVIIDEPKSGDYYGGKVAAPIFKKIAEQIIAVNGLFEENQPRVLFASNENDEHNIIENETSVKELNLINFDIDDARKILNERNISFEIDGSKNNSIVTSQQIIEEDSGVKFMLKTIQENSSQEKSELNKIPELRGMSMRNCVKALSLLGVDYKITGSGKVVSQNISAGTVLQKNISLQVICEE